MIFTEFRFLFFFLVVFLVHWGLRNLTARKVWLLLASYTFYAAWDWRFLSLIWFSTIVDWIAGRRIHEAEDRGSRRRWLMVSLTANLGLLATFKYLDFFIESAAQLLTWCGFEASYSALGIILPVGISFYTFQTLSPTRMDDVYRPAQPSRRNFLDLRPVRGLLPPAGGRPDRARDRLPAPAHAEPRRFAERRRALPS